MSLTAGRRDEHATPGAPPSAGPAGRRHIVASKLSAPPLRPSIVDRPALIEQLMSAGCAPVVLVSAPAGYGKTTILALWYERDPRPFAWVTLEASDNDPVALMAGIVSVLGRLVHLDPSIADALSVPEPPLEADVLPLLIDACIQANKPFVLVLDDLHLVNERRSLAAIGYIAERLPAGCQLALATRTDPSLPLASWRVHGRLTELRAAELSLADAEAGAMLAAAGVHLSTDLVERLVARTEGWPAALYLAALSLRDRADPEEFIARFTGATRHVADFLSEDVLARQSEKVIGFLLRTSVLDDLSPDLCDAVTGNKDGEELLRELERSNMFVMPLDEKRLAYRYHHLFAQYLRAELVHRNCDVVPELHRRAAGWYRMHGLIGRAIAHAQAAGDVDLSADLVAANWLPMVEVGHIETVRSWFPGFEDAQIEGHAPLAIAAAWSAALAGDGEGAVRFAEAARRGVWDGPMPDGTASLESALCIMTSAFGMGGISAMRRAAQRAVDLESKASGWRALALMLLGIAQTFEGDYSAARQALEEAVQLSGGETSTATTSLAYLAILHLREGDEAGALEYALRAHAVVERPGLRNYMLSICTYSIVAHLLARRGELAEAAEACQRVAILLPRLTRAYWWQMIETRLLVAPVLVALGRNEESQAYIAEAQALLAQHADAGKLPERVAKAAKQPRHPDRRSGDEHTLSAAERRILRLLASDLTLREIGSELFLSMNTVRTHKRVIYRKLGVSSRLDAVKAARDVMHAQEDDSPG